MACSLRHGRASLIGARSLLVYSCLFAVAICGMYGTLFLSGKTLIRAVDGLDQHYPFFLYIGRMGREWLRGLHAGDGLVPGVWDMSFGFGSDMFISLGAYLFDPFNWLAVLVPSKHSETAFVATVIMRLWCAGVSFLAYCDYRKLDFGSSIIAALLYSTCGFVVIAPIETFFVNPLITFPLVMRGMEEVLDGRSPVLFTVSLAATFIIYFYFGYMTCILLVPAFLAEVAERRYNAGTSLRFLARFVALSLVGVAISAFTLLPIAKVMISMKRVGLDRPFDPFYSIDYYKDVLASFASYVSVGPDSYIGFGAIGFIATMLMFLIPGGRADKILLAAYTAILLLPFAGKALNGFSYVTNRWTWAYAFVVARIVARCIAVAPTIGRTRLASLTGISACYVGYLLWMGCADLADGGLLRYKYIFAAALITTACIALLLTRRSLADGEQKVAWLAASGLLVIAGSSLASEQAFLNPSLPQLDAGTAYARVTDQSAYHAITGYAPDDGLTRDWRVESVSNSSKCTALIERIYSYDYYISLYNQRVDSLISMLGIRDTPTNVAYSNLDSRPGLNYSFGTRYYITTDGDRRLVPHGYQYLGGIEPYKVYECSSYRPVAALIDATTSEDVFLDASMTERELMLSQSVVLEGDAEGVAPNFAAQLDAVPVNVAPEDGTSVSSGIITSDKQDGIVSISFEATSNRTYYLELTDCAFAPAADASGRSICFLDESDNFLSVLPLFSPRNHMSGGKTDWVVNLGELPQGQRTIRVRFSHAGTYSYGSARIVAVDFSYLDNAAPVGLSDAGAVSLKHGRNSMICSFDATHDTNLVITTPWSEGWSASLDGRPVEIDIADLAFMRIKVPEGKHTMELRYRTPGLMSGICLSVLGVATIAYLDARHRRLRSAEDREDAGSNVLGTT